LHLRLRLRSHEGLGTGRWLEYRVGSSMVPLMPSLHPAYLLRQPAHKKLAWRDLQAVRDKMQVLGLPRNPARST